MSHPKISKKQADAIAAAKAKQERWETDKMYLVSASNKAGVDAGIVVKIANFESRGFNPSARPISTSKPKLNKYRQFDGVMALSTGYGFGQFRDDTWTGMINQYGEKYGIPNASKMNMDEAAAYRKNPAIQADMLAEFTQQNVALGRKLGGTDDDANVYALHNLGSGDGVKFLKSLKNNPDMKVSRILSGDVIAGNKSLYGDGSISLRQAYQNMSAVMTLGDVYAIEARQLAAQLKK